MTNKTDTDRTLTAALLQSLGTASWLTPTDGANIQWAIFLAAELDEAKDGRAIPQLGKLYESALAALKLSPESRSVIIEEESKEVSPLAEIRTLRESTAKTPDTKPTSKPKQKRAARSTGDSDRDAAIAMAKDSLR